MARLGAHPRLARTMLAAETDGERALAADLAALLEERDPIRGRDAPSSIALRLDLLRGSERTPKPTAAPCTASAAPPPCIAAALACAATRSRKATPAPSSPPAFPTASPPSAASWTAPSAWPAAWARACPRPTLSPNRRSSPSPISTSAAPTPASAWPRRCPAPRSKPASPTASVREEGASFDARAGAVLARRRLRFGPLVLEEEPIPAADPAALASALAAAVAERGLRDLPWKDAARQVQARIAWMRNGKWRATPPGPTSPTPP